VKACNWRPGCEQPAFDGTACYFHAKVRDGKITHARGEYSTSVEPIPMTPAERHAAESRLDTYLARVEQAEKDRARRERRERERAWEQVLGERHEEALAALDRYLGAARSGEG
jgi:hypothetical protein